MRNLLAFGTAILFAASVGSAWAADAPAKSAKPVAKSAKASPEATSSGAAEVKKTLESKFPGAEIRAVGRTSYFGLFEAMLDGQLVYTDAKVTYVFVGNIFDPEKRVNLTQERTQELTAVNWSELPLDLAIKTVKGNGSRKLAVFSDVDCPFCKRLEEELKNVTDVTVYTFLFPIESLHPDATRKSKLIWCAGDRQKTYDDLMQKGTAPSSSANCDDPVARIIALGEKYRIQATPTMIFADGRVVPGALPKPQLEAQLAKSEAAAKAKTN